MESRNCIRRIFLSTIIYVLCTAYVQTQDLMIRCPTNIVVDASTFANFPDNISRDDIVKGFYDDWIGGFGFTDNGCTPIESGLEDIQLPSASFGGTITINYVVTDDCSNEETCSATFEVVGTIMDPVIVSCPPPVVMPSGSTQAQIDSAYAIWIAGFSAIPFNALTTDLSGIISPRPGDPAVDITYLAEDPSDPNNSGTCSSSFAPPTATIIDMNDEIPTMGQWGIFSLLMSLLILAVKSIKSRQPAVN